MPNHATKLDESKPGLRSIETTPFFQTCFCLPEDREQRYFRIQFEPVALVRQSFVIRHRMIEQLNCQFDRLGNLTGKQTRIRRIFEYIGKELEIFNQDLAIFGSASSPIACVCCPIALLSICGVFSFVFGLSGGEAPAATDLAVLTGNLPHSAPDHEIGGW